MGAKKTAVPYRYKATLAINALISEDDKHLQPHWMTVGGKVHPDPYDMASAQEQVTKFLQPLLDLGWWIESFEVHGYGS